MDIILPTLTLTLGHISNMHNQVLGCHYKKFVASFCLYIWQRYWGKQKWRRSIEIFFFFFFLHLFYTLHFEILKSFLVGWWHCLLNFMSKNFFFFGEWVQPRFKSSFSIIFEKKKKKDVNIKTKMMINILEMKPYLKK